MAIWVPNLMFNKVPKKKQCDFCRELADFTVTGDIKMCKEHFNRRDTNKYEMVSFRPRLNLWK